VPHPSPDTILAAATGAGRRFAPRSLVALVVGAVGVTSACGSSGGSKQAAAMEQKTLRVGIVQNELGALPVWVGADHGMFSSRGLNVTVVADFKSDEEALKALKDEKVDVVYSDYARAIEAKSIGDYRISLVAEGYVAGPGSVNLVERSTTNTSIVDDVRKAYNAASGILVPSVGEPDPALNFSVPALMLASALPVVSADLRINGANKLTRLKAESQSAMTERLETKTAGSAVMTEPYWSEVSSKNPLSVLLDLTAGGNEEMPLGGYFAQQDFALKAVNTLKVFTQGLNEAKVSASSKATATSELVAHYTPNGAPMHTEVAAGVALGTFPLTVNAKRIQRVLDAMQLVGLAPYFKLDAMLPPDAIR
jgi:NitT/TauT family transport system substrate-binding protein